MLQRITSLVRGEPRRKKKPRMDRFAKWNQSARDVLNGSEEEAVQLKHGSIGCEHMLLAILSQEHSIAAKALQSLEIDLTKTREALERKIGTGQALSKPEGITPNCKGAMLLAVEEARHMQHHFVDSGHILLGIMRVKEDVAAQFLEENGINTDQARKRVWELLRRQHPGNVQPQD